MVPTKSRPWRKWTLAHGMAFAVALAPVACTGTRESGAEATADAPRPTLTTVTAQRTDLLFRYSAGAAGETASATSLAEIPADARGAVQVVDLSAPPAARGSTAFVQVFDLRSPAVDGTFPGRLVPRAELEKTLRAAAVVPPQSGITMYSAAWCGVCKKARAFMKAQNLAFVEKDIEKDPAAAAELARKAQAAGVSASGVPVFDVGGRILGGFDPQALVAAARPTPTR
jgi:glutaredoxin